MALCQHFDQAQPVPNQAASHAKGCEDCVPLGDTWVHLRECLICGHVGCCDSSKNRHATKHFHGTKHPVMRSVEPGDTGAGAMWMAAWPSSTALSFSDNVCHLNRRPLFRGRSGEIPVVEPATTLYLCGNSHR